MINNNWLDHTWHMNDMVQRNRSIIKLRKYKSLILFHYPTDLLIVTQLNI